MHPLDVAVLAGYIVIVAAFGAVFRRRADTVSGFTVASGRLAGWVVGLSIFGTYLSSISFLALPAKAFSADWNPLAFALSLPLAVWIAARWFIPLYRRTQDASAYAYLERRFGLWARLYAATFYLLTQLARMGTVLFLVALALEQLTQWNLLLIIVFTGIFVTAYTWIGGIEAVIWTDVLQSVVLTVGALACAVILVSGIPGGAETLWAVAREHDKFSLGSFDPDFFTASFWVVLLYGLFINLQNFGIDQSYIQRYQAARSLSAARRSVWIGGLVYLPVSILFLFIGTALFAYYTAQPALLPAALGDPAMADRVFPHFIVSGLPPGLTGLMVAGLFAAAMSSVDTSLNSSATILMTDFYRRLARPRATESEQLRFLRVTTFVLGLSGTAIALLMISIRSALDVWWNLAGIFSGGMLGLFLLGALSRRSRPADAGVAMAAGLLVIAWAALSPRLDAAWSNPLHGFMTTVLGTLTLFGIGILVSRRRPRAFVNTLHDL